MKKVLLFVVLIFIGVILFYITNDSYRMSLEAGYYYKKGDYEKAYELAKKAYKLQKYNNMAFTIMTQSKIAEQWADYLEESNKYFAYIEKVSSKNSISKQEKIRIKLMLEILINRYPYLISSKLLDENLYKKVLENRFKAEEIYDRVFK